MNIIKGMWTFQIELRRVEANERGRTVSLHLAPFEEEAHSTLCGGVDVDAWLPIRSIGVRLLLVSFGRVVGALRRTLC